MRRARATRRGRARAWPLHWRLARSPGWPPGWPPASWWARSARRAQAGTVAPAGAATTTAGAPSTAPPPGTPGGPAPATVWLCRPGLADDPCTAPLTDTVDPPQGRTSVQRAEPAKDPPIDCFYVYPTVSAEQTPVANMAVGPEEVAVAKAQASRFSQDCRIYAPIYPADHHLRPPAPGQVTAADEVCRLRRGVSLGLAGLPGPRQPTAGASS